MTDIRRRSGVRPILADDMPLWLLLWLFLWLFPQAAWPQSAAYVSTEAWGTGDPGLHGVVMATTQVESRSVSRLRLELNTDTATARLSRGIGAVEMGLYLRGEYALAGLLRDYYRGGERIDGFGFDASYVESASMADPDSAFTGSTAASRPASGASPPIAPTSATLCPPSSTSWKQKWGTPSGQSRPTTPATSHTGARPTGSQAWAPGSGWSPRGAAMTARGASASAIDRRPSFRESASGRRPADHLAVARDCNCGRKPAGVGERTT